MIFKVSNHVLYKYQPSSCQSSSLLMKTSCLRLKLVELNFFASFTTDDQSIFNVSKSNNLQLNLFSQCIINNLCTGRCVSPGIHQVLVMEEALVENSLYTSDLKYGGIFGLENLLLKMSCNPNLIQSVFYLLPIYCNGQLFIR